MIIRAMQPSDLDFAAECAGHVGWASETRTEFAGFMAHSPDGCFVALVDGARAGICLTARYNDSAFLGDLIVLQELRGRGIGRALLEHAISYLHRQGVVNVLLDGVVAALPLYERMGFRRVCRSLRFTGTLSRQHPGIAGPGGSDPRLMTLGDVREVRALDRAAFGADRGDFLERRLARFPELCRVVVREGLLAGYVMGRRAQGWMSVGPWLALPQVDRPQELLLSLVPADSAVTVGLGVLETNARAVAAVRALGLAARPDSPWRMVLGPSGRLGQSDHLYAIGSPAKG